MLTDSYDKIHPGNGQKRFWRNLGIATRYDNLRSGILSDGPADELPGLVVGFLGYRAGVDDVNIGGLWAGDHFMPLE